MKKYIAFLMSAMISIPASQAGLLDNVVDVVNKVSDVAGSSSSDKKTSKRGSRNGTNTSSGSTTTNTATGIQNIVTAKDVVENKPQGVSNRFPNDLVRIYLCFDYYNLTIGDVVKVTWYSNNNGNLTRVYETQMTVNQKSGFGEFHIKLPANTKWPVGAYRVDVMLNIGLAGSVNFDVYDSSGSSSTSNSSSTNSTSNSSTQNGSLLEQILSIANTGTNSGSGTAKTTTGQQGNAQAAQNSSKQGGGQQQQQNWPGQVNGGTATQQGAQPQQNPGMQAIAPAAAGTTLYYGNPEGGVCNEPGYDYSIKYLNGWKYLKQTKDTIKFINFDEDSNVIIQNILTAANGGKYSTKEDVLNDIKNQLAGLSGYNLVSEGEHTVNNITASQFVANYMLGSVAWQEWYICIPKPDGKLFYLFCYRSHQKAYAKYLSSARIMLASFTPAETSSAAIAAPAAQPKQQTQQKPANGDDFSF